MTFGLAASELSVGERQAEKQGVRAGVASEQVTCLVCPPLVEQQISEGGDQVAVAQTERERLPKVSFGRLSVSQSASDLAENGKRIEPVSRVCAVCQFVGGKKPLVTRLRLTTQAGRVAHARHGQQQIDKAE